MCACAYVCEFQSTPAIAGGRIFYPCMHCGGIHTVSIHARHCWRANLNKVDFNALLGGVSIHARHCWRANLCWHAWPACLWAVSIHARHCWRANLGAQGQHLGVDLFQSTPAIAGGRIALFATPSSCSSRFNPRPPLLAGESQRDAMAKGGVTQFQSTPAIAGGRICFASKALLAINFFVHFREPGDDDMCLQKIQPRKNQKTIQNNGL